MQFRNMSYEVPKKYQLSLSVGGWHCVRAQILDAPRVNILGKVTVLSGPQFPQLESGDNNSSYPVGSIIGRKD